jgi:hypothetical protein
VTSFLQEGRRSKLNGRYPGSVSKEAVRSVSSLWKPSVQMYHAHARRKWQIGQDTCKSLYIKSSTQLHITLGLRSRSLGLARCQRLMPIILATQEKEIGRIRFKASLGQ